ncbi:MAG: hypothetical protein IJJ57_00130, partial [Ruminococcus sp.]|nr:hypothetical protein [Ruminococcus sp.]
YLKDFDEINKQNLLAFKAVLVDKYKGKTVNLRIQGINKYLEYIGKETFFGAGVKNIVIPDSVKEIR